ncbi:hypothetical protein A2609_02250 [Candidatus Kaiserbacteria bacterium RIFOXYD1_FULL_47_14]|uniref:Uncharacterized protein n=1 Tax=Candidatus Kaiserbacteria bacterium RIFOXYD1_FULL_47_14 TaxID=1798533 RepID=A0A1F6G771_9BACT|nr:MAG: hypothetical protein A2609_02250 [Candidatus Kaiserbacteria bacterium RIFOXYD1_FULL_47_14]
MRETTEMPQVRKVAAPEIFHFSVDYSKSFEMMKSSSQYVLFQNERITEEHFPINRKGRNGIICFEGRYFKWRFPMSSTIALKGIERVNGGVPWRPAEVEHMFALGTFKPEGCHSKRCVVSLGSIAVIGWERFVPCMGECVSFWNLGISSWEREWAVFTDFLAVREV